MSRHLWSAARILFAASAVFCCTQAFADVPLAPGQRVSVNFAGGKEGNVVRIGTAADGTYQGCTRIHFDYEGPDPSTGQWFCASNSPFVITPLGGGPAAPAPGPPPLGPGPAPEFQPAEPPAGDLAVGACVAVRGEAGRIVRLTPGGYVIQTQGQAPADAMNWARSDVRPGPCPAALSPAQPPGRVACPIGDAPGATALDRGFLAAIRATIEHPAPAGRDGAETMTFQSLQVGAGAVDPANVAADPARPVYNLRASFTTCTDFRAAIELRRQVSNFQCFTALAGGTICQMTGTVNGMPEPTQRIPK